MAAAMRIGKDDLNMVCHKAGMGQRLDRKEAEVLYFDADLHTLAHLAHNMRLRLHPEPVVTYMLVTETLIIQMSVFAAAGFAPFSNHQAVRKHI